MDHLYEQIESLQKEVEELRKQLTWRNFPDEKPDKYGKYLIVRKDGKVHWETWNNTGWAYNHNVIIKWLPVPDINNKTK